MIFLDDSSKPMNFSINLESWNSSSSPNIFVDSCRGKKGTEEAKNTDYDKGLEVLFERLGKYNISIFKIVVEKTLKKKNLTESERTLPLDYPIILVNQSQENIKDTRIKIASEARAIGRPKGAKGIGNGQKCIRLWLKTENSILPDASILFGQRKITEAEIIKLSLDPEKIKDERTKREQLIAIRQGQQKFRRDLLDIYDSKCVISECNVMEAIDAAHVIPYRGEETNKVENGLLLRADIHNLFDLGLISIDPENLTVKVSQKINSSYYSTFENKRILKTKDNLDIISKECLKWHWDNCWLT